MTIIFGEYELVADSGLFDPEYYKRSNPEIAELNIDPLMHFLERGCREGRNPSAGFDTSHYLLQCHEIGEAPSNALLHYLVSGANRGLTPSPGARKQSNPRPAAQTVRLTKGSERVRLSFAGQDTLAALCEPVLMEIDEALTCPPDGVLLKGWMLAAAGSVTAIRLCSGSRTASLDLARSIVLERDDVISTVGHGRGFSDSRCGFVAFVPGVMRRGEAAYLEIELASGEIGFKTFHLSVRSGLDAIAQMLEGIDVRYTEVNTAFDETLGPAISAINSARLRALEIPEELSFGNCAERPKCSVVVPLFDRVDFLECQLALFSKRWNPRQTDLIYVLDNVRQRREAQRLAESAHERFGIPFRLLLLPVPTGPGPAFNAGLRAARGQFVCFMRPEVLPASDQWLERLIDCLERHANVGLLSARLLSEDGAIRHEGYRYRPIREFGNWSFPEHLNEGRRPEPKVGLRRCDAIAHGCMLMRRSLAVKLGGFDESYLGGEFEDSDLCFKVRARELTCAVNDEVELYQLQPTLQDASSRRLAVNLTLFNAWVHERRWFSASARSVAVAP